MPFRLSSRWPCNQFRVIYAVNEPCQNRGIVVHAGERRLWWHPECERGATDYYKDLLLGSVPPRLFCLDQRSSWARNFEGLWNYEGRSTRGGSTSCSQIDTGWTGLSLCRDPEHPCS